MSLRNKTHHLHKQKRYGLFRATQVLGKALGLIPLSSETASSVAWNLCRKSSLHSRCSHSVAI